MTVTVDASPVMAPLVAAAWDTDSKVGDSCIRHHRRVGLGEAESTPLETALPVRPCDVKKCVAEQGSPALKDHPKGVSKVG